MTDDVVVRIARPADARRVAELLDGGSLAPKEDPSDPAPYASALAELARTEGNDVLVAERGGEVIGVCQLLVFRHIQRRGAWCAELESVHVDVRHRGSGVGTRLVTEAVARARAAGCYRVQLTSASVRTEAHRFYRRLGFEPTHTGFKLHLI